MHREKVVIIGSGLGGLSCGVMLAKNGYQVTVLEQDGQIGGCLQCFTRRGAKFETGMHFIGSADKGQTLDKLLTYLEVTDDITLSRLDPSAYDIVSFNGQHFNFANGREPFIEQMSAYFPKQRDNIVRYCDLIEKISKASSLHSLRNVETDAAINTEYLLRSMNDVLDELIPDRDLANVLAGNLPLYAAQRDKTPFSTHAFIVDFYNQSAFRVVGGSDAIAVSMRRTIEKYGGSVLVNHKVTKIICDDTHALGVEVNNEKFIPASIVISDAHPIRTFEMLDTKMVRPAFRNRISAIPQTVGGFSVYLHFKENAAPYMNSNFYGYASDTPWDCELYDEVSWPRGYLYMHLCHEQNPKYAQCGVILSYMRMDELQPWFGTKVGRRGNDYEEFKKRKAEKLIDEVSKQFPGLREQILHYYTSTPLTYYDYLGTEGGSMYGIAKDVTKGAAYRVPHRTKVPNLLLTGQNINSHGILGVSVGTIVTCSELLTSEVIYKQISKANE